MSRRILCLLAALLISAGGHAQNLVNNGTFPVASTAGWEKIGFSGGYVNETGAYGGTDDWINLSGTLSQDLNTVPGQLYVLSFATAGHNPSSGSQGCTLRVWLGSQMIAFYQLSNVPGWFFPRFSFRAEATPTRLTFEGFDYPNLDYVSVVPAAATEPRIQLVQPGERALFTANQNIILAATTQTGPGRSVRHVEFFHSGINRVGISSNAPYTITNRLPAGEYVLSARVADSSGATMISTGVTIFVAAGPSVLIDSPVAGIAFTNGDNIVLHGTVANNNGQIKHVEFSSEANRLARISDIPTDILYDVSTTWSNAPEGNFSLSLTGTDELGQLIAETNVVVHVMPAPVLDVNQPNHDIAGHLLRGVEYAQTFVPLINGRLRHVDLIAHPGTYWDVPSIRAAIVELSGDYPGTNILGVSQLPTWRIDPFATATYSIYFPSNKVYLHAGRRYAVVLSAVTERGFIDVRVQRGDAYPAGALLEKTPFRDWAPARIMPHPFGTPFDLAFSTYIISNALPNVSLTAPTDGARVTAGSTLRIQADASDTDDGIVRVEFLVNGNVVHQQMDPPFTFAWVNVPAGLHRLEARVLDAAGYSSLSQPVLVEALPNAAPFFTIGPDPVVPEDSGPIELGSWAKGISAGAAHEINQKLQFITVTENPSLFAVLPTVSDNGTLTFLSAPDRYGQAVVGLQLEDDGGTAFNGSNRSEIKTFRITVLPVNDRPIAHSQQVACREDTSVQITLSSFDGDGDELAYLALSQPAHGTLSGSGRDWLYVPEVNYFGVDAFSFKVSDGQLESEPATVTIQIQPVNDLPVPVISIHPLLGYSVKTTHLSCP